MRTDRCRECCPQKQKVLRRSGAPQLAEEFSWINRRVAPQLQIPKLDPTPKELLIQQVCTLYLFAYHIAYKTSKGPRRIRDSKQRIMLCSPRLGDNPWRCDAFGPCRQTSVGINGPTRRSKVALFYPSLCIFFRRRGGTFTMLSPPRSPLSSLFRGEQ